MFKPQHTSASVAHELVDGLKNGTVVLVPSRRDSALTRIPIDPDLRSKLLNLAQPLELIDEEGNVVAHVLPAVEKAPACQLIAPP